MQEHHYHVDIDGTPDELWQLFWARIPHTETGDVTIDILHRGDEVGEGLVRHCTFRVPRYLLTRGKGQSWEWLTEVTPQVSWKYNAVGRPLWSEAEGRTRLEDLGDGRTRVHFSETYHAFNPVSARPARAARARLHLQGQRPPHKAVARDGAAPPAIRPGQGRRPDRPGRHDPRGPAGVTVVDLWVNALSGPAAEAFLSQRGNEGIPDLLGGDLSAATTLKMLLVTMDGCGVDVGIVAAGLSAPETEGLLNDIGEHEDRLRVALVVDRPDRPLRQCERLRAYSAHPAVALVRVTPLVHQYPLNDKLYYPVYALCAELGLPVSINVGIPGPQVRSACQHPERLEDVLIDFKGLTVIGAHMGHPFEALLMTYMLKWPDLYLSNSAYLARYMDPALVGFMNSSRGLGRVLYASDHPFLSMERAVAAARDLPLGDAAAKAFLGGTAARLLRLG